MIKVCPYFIVGDSVDLSPESAKKCLENGDFSRFFYCFVLNETGLCEIISTSVLNQPYYDNQVVQVFGIASSKTEAEEMMTGFLAELKEETGGFDVRRYVGDCED